MIEERRQPSENEWYIGQCPKCGEKIYSATDGVNEWEITEDGEYHLEEETIVELGNSTKER